MEQAHTRLIAQLNERIAAVDNTPLYRKFAETVKNAVRSGILEHGNILPGEPAPVATERRLTTSSNIP